MVELASNRTTAERVDLEVFLALLEKPGDRSTELRKDLGNGSLKEGTSRETVWEAVAASSLCVLSFERVAAKVAAGPTIEVDLEQSIDFVMAS